MDLSHGSSLPDCLGLLGHSDWTTRREFRHPAARRNRADVCGFPGTQENRAAHRMGNSHRNLCSCNGRQHWIPAGSALWQDADPLGTEASPPRRYRFESRQDTNPAARRANHLLLPIHLRPAHDCRSTGRKPRHGMERFLPLQPYGRRNLGGGNLTQRIRVCERVQHAAGVYRKSKLGNCRWAAAVRLSHVAPAEETLQAKTRKTKERKCSVTLAGVLPSLRKRTNIVHQRDESLRSARKRGRGRPATQPRLRLRFRFLPVTASRVYKPGDEDTHDVEQ